MTGITLAQVILRDTAGNRPAAGTAGRLFFNTTDSKLQRDNGDAWEDVEASVSPPAASPIYPDNGIIFAPSFNVVAGSGTATLDMDTTQIFNLAYYLTSPVNGGALEASIMLKEGTYNFSMVGVKTPDAAKVDYSVDGTNFLTQVDWYAASSTFNFIATGSFTIAASGRHLLRMTANGKRSGSSGYQISYTCMVVKPTTMTKDP